MTGKKLFKELVIGLSVAKEKIYIRYVLFFNLTGVITQLVGLQYVTLIVALLEILLGIGFVFQFRRDEQKS